MSRKEMVEILARHLNKESKYLGAPTFAYQVGEYIVDRQGLILTKAGQQVELDRILAGQEESPEELETIEVSVPLDGHDGRTLTNLANMIYSRQELIKKALGIEEDLVEDELIEKLKETKTTTIEEFLNLAQGRTFKEEGITLISSNKGPEAAKALADFTSLLNDTAKELRRASAKPVSTDNEKYTFRAWIMRLGMIGPEYKETRKILLNNLSGNTAFRKAGVDDEA